MTAPRYGGRKRLLQIWGRAQPEARTSGRVQCRHDPETCREMGRGREKEEPCTIVMRPNVQKGVDNQNAWIIQGRGTEEGQARPVRGKSIS